MGRALIATNQATWQETVLWARETPEDGKRFLGRKEDN